MPAAAAIFLDAEAQGLTEVATRIFVNILESFVSKVDDSALKIRSGLQQRSFQTTANLSRLKPEFNKYPFKDLCHSCVGLLWNHPGTLIGPFWYNFHGFSSILPQKFRVWKNFVSAQLYGHTFHSPCRKLLVDSNHDLVKQRFLKIVKHWFCHRRTNFLLRIYT